MKSARSFFGAAIAVLAVVSLMSGVAILDQGHAAAGLGFMSVAMAGMVTIKAPVTVSYKGQFVAPGTDIEVSEEEAKRLTAAHGAFGGPGDPDPGNTQMRNVDIASIAALNEQTSIHKGTGATPKGDDGDEDGIKRSDLERMNRDKLIDLAAELNVEHAVDATRAQIMDAIMISQAASKV